MIKYVLFLLFFFQLLVARNPFTFGWQESCIAKALIEERHLKISFHKKDGALKTHITKKAPST